RPRLHLSVRAVRPRPARPAARRRRRSHDRSRDRHDLACPRRSLFGTSLGRDRPAAQDRDVLHRRLRALTGMSSKTPILVDEARPSTFEVDAINERGETVATPIAGEHALTLYLDKRELLTLMTLGAAPAHLAL